MILYKVDPGTTAGWLNEEGTMEMPQPESLATVTPETADIVGRRVALPDIESPLLAEVLAMWEAKKRGRNFPARADIGPRDMAKFLRHITLYRVSPDGDDFEYRVMGDAAVQAWGRNFAGFNAEQLNAVEPGMGDVIRRICGSVARRHEPLVLRGTLSRGQHEHIRQESIFLPLGPDDGTVDHILSASWFAKPELHA